jgi:general secretion pathway protein A
MYAAYFGFREKPFNVTPDPRFFFGSPLYSEVYANLTHAVRERKGFAALTGEVGTGKTTLLRKLMDDLATTARFVYFYNTNLNFEELLVFICEELNLGVDSNDGRLGKIRVLNEFLLEQLRRGGTGVLLIDEAQNLGSDVLEDLRLLSNLETGREKLLQIVLAGQPEFERNLDRPELRQLKQRISIHCRLNCLKEREVGPFIAHRLAAVGSKRDDLFLPEALKRIALYSKGIPRLINIICDNALLIAYATSQKTVLPGIIEEVAHDLRLPSAIGPTGLDVASAAIAQKHRTEGRLHSTANAGPRETPVRQVDAQRRIIAPRADMGTGPEENNITDDGSTNERTVFQVCDADEKRNTPFTLTREELQVVIKVDGLRDVQAIAESLRTSCASTMNVVRRLHQAGIVKVVSTGCTPDTVPPGFFDIMMSVLTDAVGPMARIIMKDQLKTFGDDLTTFPKSQIVRLVGAVSREILHDRLRTEFEARMFEVIRALDSSDNYHL